ncbi:MAG: hypothetical protein ACREOF_00480 [Gemmatimonadales bacterium]
MRTPSVKNRRYAVCVDAGEYAVSLEARKIYEVWPDTDAESHGQLRVVDESGEDYLFPAEYFRILSLPPGVDRLLRASSRPVERRRRAASKARR